MCIRDSLYGVYLTFTSWDGVSSNKPFVGLKNYAAVVADSSFWQSLGLTLLYVVAVSYTHLVYKNL